MTFLGVLIKTFEKGLSDPCLGDQKVTQKKVDMCFLLKSLGACFFHRDMFNLMVEKKCFVVDALQNLSLHKLVHPC